MDPLSGSAHATLTGGEDAANGAISFEQSGEDSPVVAKFALSGLPPGESFILRVHERLVGDEGDCLRAGEVYDIGDFGEIPIDEEGRVEHSVETPASRLTLFAGGEDEKPPREWLLANRSLLIYDGEGNVLACGDVLPGKAFSSQEWLLANLILLVLIAAAILLILLILCLCCYCCCCRGKGRK